jgi:hypothetical protein
MVNDAPGGRICLGKNGPPQLTEEGDQGNFSSPTCQLKRSGFWSKWVEFMLALPHLIFIAAAVAFFVCVFCVAHFEKHKVREFVPAEWETLNSPSPYFLAVNESARRLGFEYAGAFRQDRKSKVYAAYYAVWVSPDRTMLALIAGGKTAGVNIRRTKLISYLKSNRLLESCDESTTADLSGLTDRKLLLKAGFEELYAFHQGRLAAQPDEPHLFQVATAGEVYQKFQEMLVARLQELGLARFVGAEQNFWRYSPKGALRMYASFQQLKHEAVAQIARNKLKRPGDS